MPVPRHLRNAPITEAIIDFRVKAAAGFQAERFVELKSLIAERFPKMEEQRGFQASFEMIRGQGQPPKLQDLGLHGYFFRSADEKTVAQFRVDGFTFNRVRPYTSWDQLFPQAMELWNIYASASRPQVVTRVAVRYINRIELPLGQIAFDTILRAAPVIPPELPQITSSFLTRITILELDRNLSAHVAQALEPTMQGKQPAIILDIDAFRVREFAVDDPAIEETFGDLRTFKNLIFFNYLTEETVRRFE